MVFSMTLVPPPRRGSQECQDESTLDKVLSAFKDKDEAHSKTMSAAMTTINQSTSSRSEDLNKMLKY